MINKLKFIIAAVFFSTAAFAQNVGEPAPDFTFNSLENEAVSLSQFSGKVVYIFFFGYN